MYDAQREEALKLIEKWIKEEEDRTKNNENEDPYDGDTKSD